MGAKLARDADDSVCQRTALSFIAGKPCSHKLCPQQLPQIRGFKPKLNAMADCDTAMPANGRTVVLPSEVVYNRRDFYAILASDPLCRITVTVNSPQFSRLECP